MFLATINVVLELDADLPFCWLVADERMLEQMLRVRTLVVILDEDRFDEILKLFGPFFRLETRRRIAGNEKKGPHRMHVAQRWLTLGHFKGRDAQTPQIAAIVVRRLGIVFAGNHFGSHPVRCSDERVAPANCPVQLSTHTEIN